MPQSRHLSGFSSCALLLLPLCRLSGQSVAPLQAELVGRLDAVRVKVGDAILAKAQLTWDDDVCFLRAGSIIQGRVVTEKKRSKTDKTSEIGILFESGQCNGREMKPLFLTVAALVGPSRDSDQGSDEMQPLGTAVGVVMNGNLSRQSPYSERSVSQAADTVWYEARQSKAPGRLQPGQVVGIPHLTLAVGQGEGGASILSSKGHNVELDKGTTFVLVPNLRAESVAAVNSASSSDAKPEAASTTVKSNPYPADGHSAELASTTPPRAQDSPPEAAAFDLADETEVCLAPDCSVASGEAFSDEASHRAQMSLPLKGLGYVPPGANREMAGFDYDAGIAYLGPAQFLFTFNPHLLVPRSGNEATAFRKLRLVRALLFDLENNAIVKTVDWRVPDSGRYLWPLGEDRILVHVGEELRIYGPGLKLHNQIFLGPQLAFVRVSPSSEFFAAGIVHERHTREIHRRLEEAEHREPEEDLEIRLFDSQLRPMTTISRSSRTAPPILMNEGEAHFRSVSRQRWEIVETSWVGQERVLSRVVSRCAPQGESLPGNLLFVTGCDRASDDKWYKILHADGKVVLQGSAHSWEMAETAGGNVGDRAFAIGVANATTSRLPDGVFTPSDLKGGRVTIYSAKNGQRIFSIGFPDPIPAVQTFAISPREDQVAILKANAIDFYRISKN